MPKGVYDHWKITRSPEERFWEKVKKTEGCWEWIGATNTKGYGQMQPHKGIGKRIAVHRFSYELHKGPIPDLLEVDHICCNPGCVNPDHLEVVTHQENLRRKHARV